MRTYWAQPLETVAQAIGVTLEGLTAAEAVRCLDVFGANEVHARPAATRLRVLGRQVRNPLVLLLVFAAIASTISGEWVDAAIVGAILAASIAVGYFREYRAESAISRLLDRVQITAQVVRDGSQRAVPVREVVPGDVIALAAGSIVPADAVLISATDLHVDDAVLTGESFPVLKRVGPSAEPCGLRDRAGCVQFGTNVQSGTARALVVGTGKDTAFGAIAMRAAPLWRAFACGDARHDCGGVCGKCAPRGSLSRCASLLHSSFALDAGAGAVDQEGCWCGPPQRLRSLR